MQVWTSPLLRNSVRKLGSIFRPKYFGTLRYNIRLYDRMGTVSYKFIENIPKNRFFNYYI